MAGDYPASDDDPHLERRWPLRAVLCVSCDLVQLAAGAPAEAHLPGTAPWSQSSTMRAHAGAFADEIVAAGRADATIVELASHGGYLHDFLAERGVQSLIIEGSEPLAAELRRSGVAVVDGPLDAQVAAGLVARGRSADVVVDNYLLAHVADPSGLIASVARLLAPTGRLFMEFDHLLPIVVGRQFDAFRHGHFSYLSLHAVIDLLRRHDLVITSVREMPVYGGALRLEARHRSGVVREAGVGVERILQLELEGDLDAPAAYVALRRDVVAALDHLRRFLEAAKAGHRVVVAYGAATRGATLLNAAGVTAELLPFVADRSPGKQGRLMPGSRIPIVAPSRIDAIRPDAILILTWDIASEIIAEQAAARAWGARFFVAVPDLAEVFA